MTTQAGTGPRVSWVITRLNVGGPSRHALLLARTLAERGYRTELLAGAVGPREGRLGAAGVPIVPVPGLRQPVAPLDDLRAGRTLLRRMRAGRPDVVHTHMAKAGALGRLAARRAGVPVVIHTFHGHVLEGYFPPPVAALFTAIERRLAAWTDALVAVSPAVRDELLALGVGRPDQWRVIPLGLDLDHLLEGGPEPTEARRRLGLPLEGPVVGSVGRLVPVKDIDLFLRVAARVALERPDASFVVAGDGELRRSLEERARAMLGDRVRFLGWCLDLPALYSALDVLVLTSRNEGTPTTLIEAGAAARPVVATRVGGVPDVVREGVTGLLAARGDAAGIAAGVLSLLSEPPRARALGDAGRAWVRDRFSSRRVTDELDRLYAELLARPRAGRSPRPVR